MHSSQSSLRLETSVVPAAAAVLPPAAVAPPPASASAAAAVVLGTEKVVGVVFPPVAPGARNLRSLWIRSRFRPVRLWPTRISL